MTIVTGTIMVDDAAVAYSLEGQGTANVVLIHGFAAHRHWWDKVAPYLLQSCRVLRVDLTGHGDSAHREFYSIDSWASEVIAVQQHVLGDEPSLLVAHSLGGRVAIAATRRPGNTIRGVILFDTVFPEPGTVTGPNSWKSARRTYDSRVEAVDHFRLVPVQPLDDKSLRDLAEYSVRREPDGWSWKHDYRMNPASLGAEPVRRVDVPLLIAYGENSSVVSEQMAVRAANDAGELAGVLMIPNAHHHVVLESPAAVADIILGRLNSSSPRAI